jgi:catechol 2,3-dioxygenase-like lactoylglutathione lyase family enzyme
MQCAFKHVALFTKDPDRLLEFYQKHLGFQLLRRSPSGSLYTSEGAIMCAMLKHREQSEARWIGYDHFGFQVASMDEAHARVSAALPDCHWGQRPQDGRYAEYRFLDMDGHPVDVSVEGFRTSDDLTPPSVRHVAIEASDPKRSGDFYKNVFDFKELERSGDEVVLSDGTISISFIKKRGGGSCQILSLGLQVDDPEKVASAFPSSTPLGNGKLAVTDVDGNRLELASVWPV